MPPTVAYANTATAQHPSDLSFLIAETGHPQFPGWELLAVMLMAATILALVTTAPAQQRHDRSRPATPIERLAQLSANAVRLTRRAA